MEKINVAELLRNCPKGMELDCTMYENAYFRGFDEDELTKYPIIINIRNDNDDHNMYLTKEGCCTLVPGAKCIIFPKGKTTWEGFHRPFVEGDIVSTESGIYIGIVKSTEDSHRCHTFCSTNDKGEFIENIDFIFSRFATEEEKQKLFDAIKDNGYKWNAETKTLEKLPKFKVGDKVKKIFTRETHVIGHITESGYVFQDEGGIGFIFGDEYIYELVPDKFDINTLIPFESRVLVRGDKHSYWKPAIFGYCIENMTVPYYALGGTCWNYCIPYEMNEHLLGTTKDCDEYFKTWK